jgi:membrane-bound lytic murein transglycosylase D
LRRHRHGSTGRLLLLAAPVLWLAACSSSLDPSQPQNSAQAPGSTTHLRWEESTRDQADDLMPEAQHLRSEGKANEAVEKADEALCVVLATPPGYRPRSVYLDYLAELIDEANELEAAIQPLDEIFEEPEELVVLPPIDLFVDDAYAYEIIEDSPLPESDFPLVLNQTVEKFIEAMTTSGEFHQRISTGLQRSGAYLPMIRPKFARAGLPEDLSYLPLIESAFSLKAYSRARAHGMWQFISSTGRYYGLEIGSLVDERRDPVLSTEAAVAYLSDLYGSFDDWYLALAAYNSGAGNVRRAIRRSGSRDFWVLQRYLPRETRSYVPAFIASVIVAKRPEKYGFTPSQEEPWQYDSIEVPDALDLEFLASESGISLAVLRELNPAIRRDLTPARGTTTLRLPLGTSAAAEAVLDSTPRDKWAPRMIHTVRSGDSLYEIALRYGSSVSAISQANGLRGSLIRPGQTLVVPRFGSDTRYAGRQPLRTTDDGSYVVQRNDTLWDIARGFSISVESLCDANGLERRDVIRPGQRLRIPDGAIRAVATSPRGPTGTNSSTHTVRSGDTLYDIAQSYGVTVTALRRANGLSTSRIYPGKVLRIPTPVDTGSQSPSRTANQPNTYKVQKGDTLYDIARRFGTSISALRRANGLSSSRIYPGDVLRIPTSQAKG